MRRSLPFALLLLLAPLVGRAEVDADRVRALLADADGFAELQAMGPELLPTLALLYEAGDSAERVRIAGAFYRLGQPSAEAKRVLLSDVHTDDEGLRLQVQWALGRVSADDEVVRTLLDNMRNDANPLFRDKAACALAHDQIHLQPYQRLALLEGLVDALEDEKLQVRRIALKALQIHTGQDKGFDPRAAPEERAASLLAWRRWLDEYAQNL